jgi:competence protein ComEC
MRFSNKFLSLTAVISALLLSSCSAKANTNQAYLPEAENDTIYTTVGLNDELRVSFIDVGQGDSEFIELPNGETMLIDAGTNETGKNVVDYIKSLGYTSINYVVGTHPHEDHIGGLDDVIKTFDIGSIYMPKITADTKTFEDVLDAAESKNLMINTAKSGVSIMDTEDLSVKFLAPTLDSYENTNDYSAVVKVVYGDTSYLFTGDAEEFSENLITDDVNADVLKVGHHGSSTSTSTEFLKKVSPSSAVISCGKDNSYGHPHSETLQKLADMGTAVYRTDELGTIVSVSDGKTITFDTNNTAGVPVTSQNTEASNNAASNNTTSNTPSSEETGITYVLNTNSKKIHLPECSSVNQISDKNKGYTDNYDEAIKEGYTPCKVCNP